MYLGTHDYIGNVPIVKRVESILHGPIVKTVGTNETNNLTVTKNRPQILAQETSPKIPKNHKYNKTSFREKKVAVVLVSVDTLHYEKVVIVSVDTLPYAKVVVVSVDALHYEKVVVVYVDAFHYEKVVVVVSVDKLIAL